MPIRGDDIDTDRIIPARFLKEITFENMGKYLFADERKHAAEEGKVHPCDNSAYQGAKFLIANSNFGCGSSREHAAQSIMRYGINCILAVSYSEIFYSNCGAIGVPCLRISPEDAKTIQCLVEENPQLKLSLDLSAGRFVANEKVFQFELPEGIRQSLISGKWDALAELLEAKQQISAAAGKIPYINNWS